MHRWVSSDEEEKEEVIGRACEVFAQIREETILFVCETDE